MKASYINGMVTYIVLYCYSLYLNNPCNRCIIIQTADATPYTTRMASRVTKQSYIWGRALK